MARKREKSTDAPEAPFEIKNSRELVTRKSNFSKGSGKAYSLPARGGVQASKAIVDPQIAESNGRETVINRAIEVIGDRQEALRWLGTPVRALEYATPISRLDNGEGQAAVLKVLTQLEHGVL